jgi:hypothetical protein
MLADDGVYAVNDTENTVAGKIFCNGDNGENVFDFSVDCGISKLPIELPDGDLITIKWESDGGNGVNHRLREIPRADWEFCRKNLDMIFRYSGKEC